MEGGAGEVGGEPGEGEHGEGAEVGEWAGSVEVTEAAVEPWSPEGVSREGCWRGGCCPNGTPGGVAAGAGLRWDRRAGCVERAPKVGHA